MKNKLYEILLNVDNKTITPKQALILMLELQDNAIIEQKQDNSVSKIYMGENMKNCKIGLYEIFWKSGGSSLASIGQTDSGVKWIAPCNWSCYDENPNPTTLLDNQKINWIDKIIAIQTK